jgi:hypothetical protein
MKMNIQFTIALLAACTLANAQVEPEATGPRRKAVPENMSYSLRYAQTEGFFVNSIVSADMDYAHPSLRLPFSLKYDGGYMQSIAGQSLGTGFFHHLLVSQGLVRRGWNVTASDNVSYTPTTPTIGFSGVPGTGEPISGSGTNPPSTESILVNTRLLSNVARVDLGFGLNYATTLDVTGLSQLLRYPQGAVPESDGQNASAEITRRINARNSISGQYMLSRFSYGASFFAGGIPGSFGTDTVSVDYQRKWSRQLKTDVALGPQWTYGSDNAVVPSVKGIMTTALVTYQLRSESASVGFSRGMSGGATYLPDATVTAVHGSFSRKFGRDLTVGVGGTYFRTTALQTASGAAQSQYGEAQLSRRLGRALNVFASYTAVDQSSGLAGLAQQANVLNRFYQLVSFGMTYSPSEAHRRQ